ncbi:MAG: nucleotide exchange factor GrpE [Parcubacteria group bacterium]|nr:nucleotide exchange factor GrpE [Parcubacteria group bacterium]
MHMDEDDISIEQDGHEEAGMSEEELDSVESRADTKSTKLKKELDQVKKERQEYMDGWQRAKADYVNALKRFEEDKLRAVDLGKMKAIKAILPALDSLALATELPEGFQGIARQLETAAKELGLVSFGEKGEKFDPVLHEALGQDVVHEADEDDAVTLVLQPGWKAGDMVIRPAKVRVGHFEA